MAKRYSEEEVALLKQYYPSSGVKILCNLLPTRSKDSIQSKAAKLGLKCINYQMLDNPELYNEELASKGIITLDKYIGARTKIRYQCATCNHIWSAYPTNIKSGTGCPNCSQKLAGISRRNSVEFVDKVLSSQNIIRLGEYVRWDTLMEVQNNTCKHIWKTTFNSIQSGSGCHICNKGFGYAHNKEHLPESAYLYVVLIRLYNSVEFIKVGVTTKLSDERYKNLKNSIGEVKDIIEIIKIKLTGIKTLELEDLILNNSMLLKYTHTNNFPGYTELFNISELFSILNIIERYTT